MSKKFWAQHSIKDAPTGEPTQIPAEQSQVPSKPFVTPGLAKRQQQASAAHTETFNVEDATGQYDPNPLTIGKSISSESRAARRVARQKQQVADNALERQQQEAVRRYGKRKP